MVAVIIPNRKLAADTPSDERPADSQSHRKLNHLGVIGKTSKLLWQKHLDDQDVQGQLKLFVVPTPSEANDCATKQLALE